MTCPAFRSLGLAMAAAVSAAPVLGSDAGFALAFPIEAPADAPVFAIELPAEAYATLTTQDLTDLVVVDAQGREQPISLHRLPPPAPPQAPEAFALPLPIAVPVDASTVAGRRALNVRRDAQGRLDSVDLHSFDGMPAVPGSAEWLVDVGDAAREGVDGLRFAPLGDADFRTLIDVRGSDDLVTWQSLHSNLPLLRASNDGRRIERLDLRTSRTTHRYLALRTAAGAAPLPALSSLEALRIREAESVPLASRVLDPVGISDDGRTIDYGRVGPLPVQEAEVRLVDGDGIVEFRIEEQIGERWQPTASGTAWRLSIDGETLEATPTPLWRSGVGPLRLVLGQSAPAPRLVLRYAPARIIVAANGERPFRLLAGSARQRHQPVAMAETLAAIRQRRGESWQPPVATVGPAESRAGPAALAPHANAGRLGLWGVLGLGALVVGAMAWRLLKDGAPRPVN